MFKGIADQIKEAQKEIIKQETLQNYFEMLTNFRKEKVRKERKTNTAFTKQLLPHLSSQNLDQIPGLRSLFYVVLEKQDNENDPKRLKFLETYMLLKSFPKRIQIFDQELEKVKPLLKSKRETRSLRVLVKNIRQATMNKYYFQEVSSLLYLSEKAGEVNARSLTLEKAIDIGKKIQLALNEAVDYLKQEDSWGSWELYFSRKVKFDAIPPSEIDKAFNAIPYIASLMNCFAALNEPFFPARDILILKKMADEFVEGLISDMIQDWLVESKTKKMRARINQSLGNINVMIRILTSMREQNKSEITLMDVEGQNRLAYTEDFVRKKLSDKI